MITSDEELQTTQERLTFLYQTVTNIRAKARTGEEYRLYSNSYLVEIEKMNAEVLTYLKRHPSERTPTEAA
jgi:hypothetical protein